MWMRGMYGCIPSSERRWQRCWGTKGLEYPGCSSREDTLGEQRRWSSCMRRAFWQGWCKICLQIYVGKCAMVVGMRGLCLASPVVAAASYSMNMIRWSGAQFAMRMGWLCAPFAVKTFCFLSGHAAQMCNFWDSYLLFCQYAFLPAPMTRHASIATYDPAQPVLSAKSPLFATKSSSFCSKISVFCLFRTQLLLWFVLAPRNWLLPLLPHLSILHSDWCLCLLDIWAAEQVLAIVHVLHDLICSRSRGNQSFTYMRREEEEEQAALILANLFITWVASVIWDLSWYMWFLTAIRVL